MNAVKAMQLLGKYARCPECGNETLGDGEGTMHIGDDTFRRTCKCGWRVEVIVHEEDSDADI